MWSTLSPRQRRTLVGLGLANVLLLAVIGALALAPGADAGSPSTPTHAPDTAQATACRAIAAQALVERDVAATVALGDDGGINFALGSDDPAAAWDAFAVAAELPASACGPYDPIRVDVPDPAGIPGQRLIVEARWIDVLAWWQGRIDDTALNERTGRSTYVLPASAP
jgi:hypothetical protein